MFQNAIVKIPSRSLINGITTSSHLGKPDYENALRQHEEYIRALEKTGVTVTVLDADERYPDSCFVEDPAVLTPRCAVITNPGAGTRSGEVAEIIPVIKRFFPEECIHYIKSPGTLEGGDVMMVGDHYYVGLSARSNEEGIRQFSEILAAYGYTVSAVPLFHILHLKTGADYIGKNTMVLAGEFITAPAFESYDKIIVPEGEEYAANCIEMNDYIILPAGYPGVEAELKKRGFEPLPVDTSEYQKIDGSPSCLSLRFTSLI